MPLNRELLNILVCPVTKLPVRLLSASSLDALNQLIHEGNVENAAGNQIVSPLSEALITQNGSVVYPVEQGIPVMLEDRAIPVNQFENPKILQA
ncbi:MAG: Trm112 family protein [Gammaproteobacteria bacterium]|nr:Trm112 family protein [Gammaproteobacteria bacterium]MYD75878.1 Trm112 family protein [Gammaproteobacteria bacterium]MYJ52647.1 Trm112 family protein [Gammaproteobacteria bacterium]